MTQEEKYEKFWNTINDFEFVGGQVERTPFKDLYPTAKVDVVRAFALAVDLNRQP